MDIEDLRTVKAGKKSQVVIALDSDTHPSLDELEEISNEISSLFDAKEEAGELNFGAGYTLEVTTPGVDLPLSAPRHFRRNRGRLIHIREQTFRVGALDAEEKTVALIEAGAKNPQVFTFPVSDLAGAVVEVEFNNPPVVESELAGLTFDEVAKVASTGEEDK